MTKYKLGTLLESVDRRNSDLSLGLENVRGISIQKLFIPTRANMKGVSLRPYKLVEPGDFAYVPTTSRNGDKITIARNESNTTYLISSSYLVFRVKRPDLIDPGYLFIYFNRSEFDRFARFNSWGSARETLDWDDLCDIEIECPELEEQKKTVNLYDSVRLNYMQYRESLSRLRQGFEISIQDLKNSTPQQKIGRFLKLETLANFDLALGESDVRGISIEKKFISTKANLTGVNLASYTLVRPKSFAFVTVTSRNGEKISIAFNSSEETFLCSSSYVVFSIANETQLLPEFLMLFLTQESFDRYARFHSWGSARETFTWEEMKDVEIPVPSLEVQQSLVDIYVGFLLRSTVVDQLEQILQDLPRVLFSKTANEEVLPTS